MRIARTAWLVIGLVGLIEDAPSLAQSQTTTRIVQLLDGSTFRGELVELVAGDHVTIRLPTGELRRFALADVLWLRARSKTT